MGVSGAAGAGNSLRDLRGRLRGSVGELALSCPAGRCWACWLLVQLLGLLLFLLARETKFLLGSAFFIFARNEILSGGC